jgi:phosphoglycerol transferase MdoB-like AlkP superfamily enzyme
MMAENENIVTEESVSRGQKIKAGLKEWGRKKIVNLKRKPQTIVLLMLFITTALWLIWLYSFSRTIYENSAVNWCGLAVFVNTLVSILIIALFGNAFPKRKKPNIVFIVLLFVFMAIIIVCDIGYFVEMGTYINTDSASGGAGYTAAQLAAKPYMQRSLNLAIAHIVLVAVCAILLATLPLYSKAINMINTRKDVEDNNIKETIDIEED